MAELGQAATAAILIDYARLLTGARRGITGPTETALWVAQMVDRYGKEARDVLRVESERVEAGQPPTVCCPRCPVCGQLPGLVLSVRQVFCDNDQCQTFCWDPSRTPEQNRAEVHHVDLYGQDQPTRENM